MQIEFKKQLARTLAGIPPDSAEQISDELSEYMGRVFDTGGPEVD